MIDFLDLSLRNAEVGDLLHAACADVLNSGRYVNGPMVEAFEGEWADYLNAKHVVGVANGLDAIRLALQALGIHHGDEVLVPGISAIATALAVQQLDAVPVIVDVDQATGLMDLDATEQAITHRTKAIVPVHLYGRAVNMDRLMEIAERHNLVVVEDCAQAQGAEWQGRKVGTIGHAGAFSFYPTKNLGAVGDAGAVATNDPRVAITVKALANYGAVADRYDHRLPGWNSRLDPMQARCLSALLPYLDDWNRARTRIAWRYCEALLGDPNITAMPWTDSGHVWHLFTVKATNREKFRTFLYNHGIGTEVHYPSALCDSPALLTRNGPAKNAQRIARTIVSLPCHPWLPDSDITHIERTLRTFGVSTWQSPTATAR